jgi:hypothetical protein
LRARVATATGFILGVIIFGLIVRAKLLEYGCKANMGIMEYAEVGTEALIVLMIILSIGSYILFGIFSVPKAIKKHLEIRQRYGRLKLPRTKINWEEIVIMAATVGTVTLIALAIFVIGIVIGYISWTLAC